MKKTLLHVAALGVAILLAGCLGPDSPEEQQKAIAEMQAKKLPMTEQQKSGLEGHLKAGQDALAAGNKEAASAAFEQALKILKTAEDTALYNKAD